MITKINTDESLTLKFSDKHLKILRHLCNLETTIANATKDDNFSREEITL